MGKGSQLLGALQNLVWNSDGQKPPPNLRRSQTTMLNKPSLFLLFLTLVFLANAAEAVDYQEEWEEEEADVSHVKLRFSSLKVIFIHLI